MSPLVSLIVLQIMLPVALIVFNALLPCRGWVEFLFRLTFGIVFFLVLTYGGVWLFPPFWWPWLVLLVHLVWAAVALRGLVRRPLPSRSFFRWLRATVFGALSLAALALLWPMLKGQVPLGPVVDLANPLGPGRYLVASGGSDLSVNNHLVTLGDRERFADFRGQSYAVDIVGLNALGLPGRGVMPPDPRDYAIYGAQVLSPCSGDVLHAEDGLPDQQVPNMDSQDLAGNHVVLECGDARVILAHLAPGTVAVIEGDRVETGRILGSVGNSGNTSQPHLHLHVQRGGSDHAPLSGDPVWFTIEGEFLTRGERFTVPDGISKR